MMLRSFGLGYRTDGGFWCADAFLKITRASPRRHTTYSVGVSFADRLGAGERHNANAAQLHAYFLLRGWL